MLLLMLSPPSAATVYTEISSWHFFMLIFTVFCVVPGFAFKTVMLFFVLPIVTVYKIREIFHCIFLVHINRNGSRHPRKFGLSSSRRYIKFHNNINTLFGIICCIRIYSDIYYRSTCNRILFINTFIQPSYSPITIGWSVSASAA